MACISAAARMLGLSWDEVDRVMQPAVVRGLAHRVPVEVERIGVDEKSFQKRREYVTVVSNIDRATALHVADGRTGASLYGFCESLEPEERGSIKAVAMDTNGAYIHSTPEAVDGAHSKFCFYRFHVSKLLNDAANGVRKQENRELWEACEWIPGRTKYLWTQNPEHRTERRRTLFKFFRTCSMKAGCAWAIEDAARHLWSYAKRGWALRPWKMWIGCAQHNRLEPMKKAGRTVRDHL